MPFVLSYSRPTGQLYGCRAVYESIASRLRRQTFLSWNPFGPSTFISQPSVPREPMIDPRQSPGLSLRACSTSARLRPRRQDHLCYAVRGDTAIFAYSTNTLPWSLCASLAPFLLLLPT